jgi:hypothetical protein
MKQQGDAAFKKQDYLNASVFYTQVHSSEPFPWYIIGPYSSLYMPLLVYLHLADTICYCYCVSDSRRHREKKLYWKILL